jgi:large subunit ribosomal protein L4
MKLDLYSVKQGALVGTADAADAVFGNQVNDHVIYDAIKAELANSRQGTVNTKERGDVAYTNSKPYRQKGTGRARAGSRRSPIWVGGGTIFGPHPRDFTIKLPKKMRLRAMASLLSAKVRQKRVRIVEDFAFESGKTKELAELIGKVSSKDRVMLIIPRENPEMVKRAARNLSWLRCLSSDRLAYKDMFYAREVLIMQGALKDITDHYSVKMKGGE